MPGRALVLGGGGVTGLGWEIGLLSGLAAEGLTFGSADVVIGTSAGSAASVHVASGADLEESYAAQIEGRTRELQPNWDLVAVGRMALALAMSRGAQDFARRIGRIAVSARTIPEGDRLEAIASRLPVHRWPAGPLQVTTVDAQTGALVLFDAAAGVPLIDAVAASCAVPGVWPAVTIQGRRYVDGGVLSGAHASLASGCDRVVVIAPIVRSLGPIADVRNEVAALRDGGARVALVAPDEQARAVMGRNALDPARRRPSAEAGRRQAASVVEELTEVWGEG